MPRAKKSPSGMPITDARGGEREQLAQFWKQRIQEIDTEHRERIELLRTVGEHPSPLFQRVVMNMGGLGMPKSLLAKMLGLTASTLESAYGDDYALGKAYKIKAVAENMLRVAVSETDPNNAKVGMAILDRVGGADWAPPVRKTADVTDPSAPAVIDSSTLSAEDRAALREIILRSQNRDDDEDNGAGGAGAAPE
jgi:hypothetical protein